MSSDTKHYDNRVSSKELSDIRGYSYHELLQNSIDSIIKENPQNESFKDTSVEIATDVTFYNVPQVNLDPMPKYYNYMSKSQNWVGHVIEITENEFTAKLEDKNNPTTHEIAQFDIDDISPGDREMFKQGALFYWSVGKASVDGQIIKQSMIRFKRSIDLTEEEFEQIMDKVDQQYNNINWD